MKRSLIFISLLVVALSCGKDEEEPAPAPSSSTCVRVGAICKDGTSSTATGSGACSGHGGVDHWLCK